MESPKASKKVIVLSFDGGGSRMVLQYAILKRILAKFPSFLQSVSVFAGVSAGSLLAAALLTKLDMDKVLTRENVERIFSRMFSQKVGTLGGLTKSKYSNENLKHLLEENFGGIALSHLSSLSQKIFIPTFRVDGKEDRLDIDGPGPKWLNRRVKRWHTVYHHTFDTLVPSRGASTETIDAPLPIKDVLLSDAILESSSAPYYFPIYDGFVDGGMACNNPSLCVLAKLISLGNDAKDIYILSIGSGEKSSFLNVGTSMLIEDQMPNGIDAETTPTSTKWGLLKWAPNLLDLIFDASSEVTSENAYKILGDGFWRIQPVLSESITLDDPSKYNELIEIAENFDMENTFNWIGKLLS